MSPGWAVLISLISFILAIIFVIFTFDSSYIVFNFDNFKNTDKNEKNIFCTFLFINLVSLISIFILVYSTTFLFTSIDKYEIIDTKKIEFFDSHENDSLGGILFGNSKDISKYNFTLKNSESQSFIKSISPQHVDFIYENIKEPYLLILTKENKNFLYCDTIEETKLVLPLKFKEVQ